MSEMENINSAGRTQAKSARRALDLLEALSACREGLGFVELAQRVKVPKSSLHELLAVLTARSYLAVDPETRRYTLGVRVWELGQAYVRYRELVNEARPEMERIVQALNETVQLSVLDGVDNVYLAKVDCTHPIRLQSEVGKRLPAHATGVGKALLAALSEDERRARLGRRALPRFTGSTITDRARLERELAATRERGFAVDNQEYTPNLQCLAVTIRDHTDRVVASISAAIPLMRAAPSQFALALRLLAEGSLEISRRLGGSGTDPMLVRLLALAPDELAALVDAAFDAQAAAVLGEEAPIEAAGA
jgi:DNA-binding IclR family transcriptional regulator